MRTGMNELFCFNNAFFLLLLHYDSHQFSGCGIQIHFETAVEDIEGTYGPLHSIRLENFVEREK